MDDDRGDGAEDVWDDDEWSLDEERRYQERRAAERAAARRRRFHGAVFGLLVLMVLGAGTTAAGVYSGWWEWPPWEAEPEPLPTRTVVVCPTPDVTAAPVAEVVVAVLNSTDRSGLAAETAASLEERGFEIGAVGNDEAEVPGTAVVRHGPGGLLVARTVAAQVDGAELLADDRDGTAVDLVLGEAFGGLRTAEEAAALTEPAPVPTPEGCVPFEPETAATDGTTPAPGATDPAATQPPPTG